MCGAFFLFVCLFVFFCFLHEIKIQRYIPNNNTTLSLTIRFILQYFVFRIFCIYNNNNNNNNKEE